ncbi:hypothetical protein HMPREF9696_02578 [Afipia clevelandensis ATCC 49720]|uniref:Porin n=2 Tax=Afipia clevelandensis TaxID=1034 RepID=K8P1J5_9BRAD|nr:hypothetical protein HMPREF9696_02578 [Afipia clevelandensis ATCC 49720]
MMGIVMKKVSLSIAAVAVAAMGIGSASAADLPAKMYTKAPPPVVVSPWDVAFGAAITNNYVFRGISQSNRGASVSAYFEPRYNITPDLQLYAGVAGNSISFANRAAAEIDVYGGIRPTFGPLALDFGVWGYIYPSGQCIDTIQGGGNLCPLGSSALVNGNVMKGDVSYYEAYGKATYTFNDMFALGGSVWYSPNFLNFGFDSTYASVNAKFTAPSSLFGNSGIGAYISGEYGHQWLGTTDAFYAFTPLPDYNTWNVGVGFTYKVFTLDLRYSGTDLGQGNCNAITSDFGAVQNGSVTLANPGGFGSKWCGDQFIAKLSADVTLGSLK